MSEEVTPQGADAATTPQGDTAEPQGTPAEADATPTPADTTDWKAEARKHEARAKKDARELADLRKKLEQMVEPEKVADTETRLRDLEQADRDKDIQIARLTVGLRKGLTESQVKRLVGSSEEEFEADAETLLAELQPPKKATAAKEGSNATGTGQPSLTPGQLLAGAVFGN